jgi:hypothetical protein
MPSFSDFTATAALLLSAAWTTSVLAQATPAATAPAPYSGFALPDVGGSLRYSLTASESVVLGYNGQSSTGTSEYTNLSGNLAYLSSSTTHPFSAVYSGGYLIGNSSFPSYTYQDLALSQVLKTKYWDFIAADSVDYLPQTPVTGLSGIPGAGDINVSPIQVGPTTGLGILTLYATRVTNVVSGSATRHLTESTTFSGTGSYMIQRYTGSTSTGLDNDQESAVGSLQHRIDARNSVGASYLFSNSKLNQGGTGVQYGFQTQSVLGSYTRELSRQFTVDVSAGPQWLNSSGGNLLTSGSVNLSTAANLRYLGKVYTASLSYSRGISNGDGVVLGSRNDIISFSTQRQIGHTFNVAGLVGYNRSESLANITVGAFSNSGVVAGGQLTAQLRRSLSAFASYSVQRQLFDGNSPTLNAFNGHSQYISVGVTYSPKPLFGRK